MKKKMCSPKFLKIIALVIPLIIGHNFSHAQTRKLWSVPKEAVNVKNPLANDAGLIKTGKTLYTTYCTPCHGDKGKGDGIAAAALNPKPADHTSPATQAETDGALFYKISEGNSPMPPYKASLTEAQRWDLVDYIRTLAKKSK